MQALRGDVRPDDAAVVPITLLAYEFLRLEAGEQAGDIRFRGDHHAADSGTGEAGFAGTAKDAQDVVLRVGESEGLEALLEGAMEKVGAAHEGKQGLLLGTGEAEGLLGSR